MWPSPGWTRADYDPEISQSVIESLGGPYLMFIYRVQAGDEDDGIWLGSGDRQSLQNPGGITDYSGRSPTAHWDSHDKEYGVEARSGIPIMQRGWFSNEPRDGDTYQPGELITVSTNWERPVTVDASNPPYVNIFMNSASPAPGRSPARADYNPELTAEHWEHNVLVFSYTVQPGDADDNGIQVGGSSLQNAGGITDYNGNAADGSWSSWERGHDVGDTGGPASSTWTSPTVRCGEGSTSPASPSRLR